jgi:hypothetical protein
LEESQREMRTSMGLAVILIFYAKTEYSSYA